MTFIDNKPLQFFTGGQLKILECSRSSFIASAACLILSMPVFASIETPVAHWAFEEPSYTGASSEVIDQLGLSHGSAIGDANTDSGDPAWTITVGNSGNTGRYLVLDGSGDYVRIPFAELINPSGSFAISLWVKSENTGTHSSLVSSRADGTYGFTIYDNPGGKWLAQTGRKAAHWDAIVTGVPLQRGSWQHVVYQFDSMSDDGTGTFSGNASVYIDGTLIAQKASEYSPLTAADGHFFLIGAGGSNGGSYRTSGSIDEVMLFDQALPQSSINYLARQPGLYAVAPMSAQVGRVGLDFLYTLPAEAFVDTSGNTISYTATDLPNGMSIAPLSGEIAGSPASAGSFQPTITATSGATSVTQTLDITINANTPPLVSNAIPDQFAPEDLVFTYTISTSSFSDSDPGDSLSYSATALPSWLFFDEGTRTFSGTPDTSAIGNHSITVSATDDAGASASDSFSILVSANPIRTVVELSHEIHRGKANAQELSPLLSSITGMPVLAASLNAQLAALIDSTEPQPTTEAEIVAIAELLLRRVSSHPVVHLDAKQGGSSVRKLRRQGGPVTITAHLFNPDAVVSPSFDWSSSDSSVLNRATEPTPLTESLTFDPSSLPAGALIGFHTLVTRSALPAIGTLQLQVAADGISTDSAQDKDGDGVQDAYEGNLEATINTSAASLLQTVVGNDSEYVMQADDGTVLRLGSVARSADSNQSAIQLEQLLAHGAAPQSAQNADTANTNINAARNEIFDFEIARLPYAGASVNIVVPLSRPLDQHAAYIKYHPATGWLAFVEDGLNRLSSSPVKDGLPGQCPSPSAAEWNDGLSAGDACIRITLQDGGPNDADRLQFDGQEAVDVGLNGNIKDPGAIAYVGTPAFDSTLSLKSGLRGVGSIGLWAVLLLLTAALHRFFRYCGTGIDRSVNTF